MNPPNTTTTTTATKATADPADPAGPATTLATTTTTTASSQLSLSTSHSLSTSPSGIACLHKSQPTTQELSSRVLYEATPCLAPPQRAEFDDLAAQVSELLLSHAQETVGIKRDIEQIKLDMTTMASGIESL